MNPKSIYTPLLVACSLLLTACQAIPPMNFSVPNVGFSKTKIDAELKSSTVTLARTDEVTGNMPSNMNGVAGDWQIAIIEALNKMVIFKDDAKKKLNLSVKITSAQVEAYPSKLNDLGMVTATYTLIDRANGDVIYTRNISSEGLVPFDFSFYKDARRMEALNRAVQNNITQFLQDLETININKPMFPSQPSTK